MSLLLRAETIKKKYSTILDMLKKERLTFGNQLEWLENAMKKQEEEIKKLKVFLAKKSLDLTAHIPSQATL